MSFEWWDRLKRFAVSSPFPVAEKLVDVGGTPFLDMRHRPPRKATPKYQPTSDGDGCFRLPVAGVKVGRVVISIEHSDHDSKKPADFGHETPFRESASTL